ncbi:Checkpoint kinase 2 [Mortierella sp. GBA30]|nr:Checkpoint kinase 2 [Mortierella sp. GBA30]
MVQASLMPPFIGNDHLIGKGESVILSSGDSIRIKMSYHFTFQAMKARIENNDPKVKLLQRSYQILPQTLGKGTFATVHIAIHRKSKIQLAVKVMDRIRYALPENSGGTNIEREVEILKALDHPNVIPIVDVFKSSRYIYLFMQMFTGGDLFDYTVQNGPLPEFETKFVVYQTLQALQYLHGMNISHRDLKPENLLLSSPTPYPRIVLTDFGMAREFDNEGRMSTMCGTYAYMAPEVFDAKHMSGACYDCSADCWSLGITMYVVVSGAHPFTSNYATENEHGMRQRLKSRSLDFPRRLWKGVSLNARLLLRSLLKLDPEERSTAEQAFESDWIQEDLAWLQHKYRECVLIHWEASSQFLDTVHQQVASASVHRSMRLLEKRSDLDKNCTYLLSLPQI